MMDLISQNIFKPRLLIIDGFNFDDSAQSLTVLKNLAGRQSMVVWFTLRTHRHDHTPPDVIPPALEPFEDLFNIILQLQPEGKTIHVKPLRGAPPDKKAAALCLDPSTMLVKDPIRNSDLNG